MIHRATAGTLQHPARGYTLVEMLVATFVFALLGTLLVQSVSGAVRAWRTAESRRDVYERAQLAIGFLEGDMGSIFCDTRVGRDTSVRMVLRQTLSGSGDLRFVRRISGELNREATRQAGERLPATGYRGLVLDPTKPAMAGEGLEEVLYVFRREAEQGGVLWRAVRSPIGGAGSLLDLAVSPQPATGVDRSDDSLVKNAMPLIGGVLYFGVQAWDPKSTYSWEQPKGGAGAPALTWDSRDKYGIFPDLMRITLVLAGDAVLDRGTRLASGIDVGSADIPLDDPRRLPDPENEEGTPFIKIDDEWIRYEGRDLTGAKLTGCHRGQRGTQAAAHAAGAKVEYGTTFVVVLPVRASR